MDFDLPCLDTFVRLADCGCFSEVARLQNITQPAASMRVARLESATGLRLFARQADGLCLTREGTQLLGQARKILGEQRRLEVRMERYVRESRGVVKVMIDRSVSGLRLAEMLRANSQDFRLEIVDPRGVSGSWNEALTEDEVDLVVTATFLYAGDHPTLARYDLERQRGTTIAWNRAYFDFDVNQFRFPEVLRSSVLIPGESLVSGYRPFLERWCMDSYGSLPPDILVFEDEATVREACCAGLGVMIFPGDGERRMALNSAGLGTIKTFESLLPEAYSYSVYSRAGETNEGILKTAQMIVDVYPALTGAGELC